MTPPLKEQVSPKPIPNRAGIGLRADHYQAMLETLPDIGWLEIHSENYFGLGGKPLYYLEKLAEYYPLSFHGVGLSIGSTDEISISHLSKLKNLIKQFQPGLVSEHLSWGSFHGKHYNDLFPLPYTPESLEHMVNQVSIVQDYLNKEILIENVSSYLQFECSTLTEWDFLTELAEKSGCGILLDINNIYVNSCNHRYNAKTFIDSIPTPYVKEIHLAGHTVKEFENSRILIDTHNKPVTEDVWSLYLYAVNKFSATPTLIEWDTDLPELDILLSEANKADNIMQSAGLLHNHEQIA